MFYKTLIWLLSTLLTMSSVESEGNTEEGEQIMSEYVISEYVEPEDGIEEPEEAVKVSAEDIKKVNQLTGLSLREAAKGSDKEYVMSGYSINEALYQLYPYATGDAKEILTDLIADVKVKDDKFKSANIFIIDDSLKLNTKDESGFVRKNLQAKSIVDFVNKFANDNTNGLIPQMINRPFEDSIKTVVMNAVYFKGEWVLEFSKEATYADIFHSNDGDVERDFMHMTEHMRYNGSDMIELRYKNSNFAMDIIKDVKDIDKRMTQYINELDKLEFQNKEVRLTLPKFEISSEIAVKDQLIKQGYAELFNTSKPAFDKLADDLVIDDIMQKAKIIVDEKGTEAAAVTMIMDKATCAMPADPPVEFTVDSQFLYIIRDTKTNAILFAGFIR